MAYKQPQSEQEVDQEQAKRSRVAFIHSCGLIDKSKYQEVLRDILAVVIATDGSKDVKRLIIKELKEAA